MALTPLPGAATLTVKVGDFNAFITALSVQLDNLTARIQILEDEPPVNIEGAVSRIEALESRPDPVIPPDLTARVEALENMVRRVPAENPQQQLMGVASDLGRPADIDPDEITMVYDRVTLYYHDLELHAQRIGENRWRLVATLNYIVVSPAVWTYDEIVEGSADEVYRHAMRRLQELAELKPQHDEVHARVKEMSEGVD